MLVIADGSKKTFFVIDLYEGMYIMMAIAICLSEENNEKISRYDFYSVTNMLLL
jgi:hypothetical protein